MSLDNLIKISPNKKALRKKCPSMFPKSGPSMEADAYFRALLTYLSRSPVKKPPYPQGPLHGIPLTEMPRY